MPHTHLYYINLISSGSIIRAYLIIQIMRLILRYVTPTKVVMACVVFRSEWGEQQQIHQSLE